MNFDDSRTSYPDLLDRINEYKPKEPAVIVGSIVGFGTLATYETLKSGYYESLCEKDILKYCDYEVFELSPIGIFASIGLSLASGAITYMLTPSRNIHSNR